MGPANLGSRRPRCGPEPSKPGFSIVPGSWWAHTSNARSLQSNGRRCERLPDGSRTVDQGHCPTSGAPRLTQRRRMIQTSRPEACRRPPEERTPHGRSPLANGDQMLHNMVSEREGCFFGAGVFGFGSFGFRRRRESCDPGVCLFHNACHTLCGIGRVARQ